MFWKWKKKEVNWSTIGASSPYDWVTSGRFREIQQEFVTLSGIISTIVRTKGSESNKLYTYRVAVGTPISASYLHLATPFAWSSAWSCWTSPSWLLVIFWRILTSESRSEVRLMWPFAWSRPAQHRRSDHHPATTLTGSSDRSYDRRVRMPHVLRPPSWYTSPNLKSLSWSCYWQEFISWHPENYYLAHRAPTSR